MTLLQNGKSIFVATTNGVGLFSFDSLQDGEYQLDAVATGFQPARYIVILGSQTRNWKRSLRVTLSVGKVMGHCDGTIEVIKGFPNRAGN